MLFNIIYILGLTAMGLLLFGAVLFLFYMVVVLIEMMIKELIKVMRMFIS